MSQNGVTVLDGTIHLSKETLLELCSLQLHHQLKHFTDVVKLN